jgi:tRNA(Arg) A34 adenosine deaminase TadA
MAWYRLQMTGEFQDQRYLMQATELAAQSPELVGCGTVLVSRIDGVLAAEYNSQRRDNIAIHHAEIKAILTASAATRSRIFPDATAYCSCEPCAMCLTALSLAKIERVVFRSTMADLFPDDPQAQLDSAAFVAHLNFVPTLEHVPL